MLEYPNGYDIVEVEALYKQEPVKVREPAVLIRITKLYRYGTPTHELYDIPRGAWVMDPERRKPECAFAV